MRYYIRAKEFIKHLLSKLRGVKWGTGRFGHIKDWGSDRLGRLRDRDWGAARFDAWEKIRSFRAEGLHRNKFVHSIKNFEYEKFLDQIFSPESYRTIHWSFLVSLLLILTYTVGKMTAYIVFPPPKTATYKGGVKFSQQFFENDGREELEQILATDLFRTKGGKASSSEPGKVKEKEEEKENLVCEDSNRKSSLPWKLVNTVVLQNREKSLAAVQDKKKVHYLREGDGLDSVSIEKISRLKMVFANHRTGECEYIAMNDAKQDKFWRARKPQIVSAEKGRKLMERQRDERVVKVGNTYQIKKEVKDEILDNINTILTQARAVEIKNPDGSLCFKMVDIVPGSPYTMLDIQNNDVICSINGKKIENLNTLFALFGKARDIRHFEMVVKRDGQEIPLEYNFE